MLLSMSARIENCILRRKRTSRPLQSPYPLSTHICRAADLLKLGTDDLAKGEFDRAVQEYSQAIQQNPSSADAFFRRGVAYSRKAAYSPDINKAYDLAIADYSQAIRLDPSMAFAFYNRGVAYQQEGDQEHALQDFNDFIRMKPDMPRVFELRGRIYAERGDQDRAIHDYTEAIRLKSKDPGTFRKRGAAYLRKGEFDHAIADYTEAIGVEPKKEEAFMERGVARYYSGDLSGAEQDFRQFIQLTPALHEFGVIWLYIVRSKTGTGAEKELKTNAAQIKSYGWTEQLMQLYLGESSPEIALRAADKDFLKCLADFYVGEYQATHGKRSEALQLWRSASQTCAPNDLEYAAAQAELKGGK